MSQKRIDELARDIRIHNRLYYDEDSPILTDTEYDAMKDEMRSLCPNHPVFNEIGHVTFGVKVKHSSVMGSLEKCHTPEEVVAKFIGKTVVILPKIDGFSLSLKYRDGRLFQAATRGDGKEGEDVTANACMIKGVPLTIDYEGDVEVRGEGVIPSKWFYSIMDVPGYDGRPDGFANPRNAAAGSVRQKNPSLTANRNVHFVGYSVMDKRSKTEQLLFLRVMGFEIPKVTIITVEDAVTVAAAIDDMHVSEHPYDTDGVVITLDSKEEYEAAGWSGKYPKGALAYKFETEKAAARVKSIERNATRTGRIVPVLNIEPTDICGSVVSRITLNNEQWLRDMDVAAGDLVEFEKANEIIPRLLRVLDRPVDRQLSTTPSECPCCSGEVAEKGKGGDIECVNEECPAKFYKHIRRILEVLNVKGLDETTLVKLGEAGLLPKLWSVLDLDFDAIVKAGFGAGEARVWTDAIKGIETTPERLLACMGVPTWGCRMFEVVIKNSGISPEYWIKAFVAYAEGDITAFSNVLRGINGLKGVGVQKINALSMGVSEGRANIAAELAKRITVKYSDAADSTRSLSGMSFCCTGTLSKDRNAVQQDIRSAGGEIKSSVSSNLDFLVAGSGAGSKLQKAEAAGVKVISEEDLYVMING